MARHDDLVDAFVYMVIGASTLVGTMGPRPMELKITAF
jgi:hypothetical protein